MRQNEKRKVAQMKAPFTFGLRMLQIAMPKQNIESWNCVTTHLKRLYQCALLNRSIDT